MAERPFAYQQDEPAEEKGKSKLNDPTIDDNAFDDAIQLIRANSLRTGTFCFYQAERLVQWRFRKQR